MFALVFDPVIAVMLAGMFPDADADATGSAAVATLTDCTAGAAAALDGATGRVRADGAGPLGAGAATGVRTSAGVAAGLTERTTAEDASGGPPCDRRAELWTAFEREAALPAARREGPESARAPFEFRDAPVVFEPVEEAVRFALLSDSREPFDDDLLDSDDDLELDDELDDESEELRSDGPANATAGVVATAAPMPRANASAVMRIFVVLSADAVGLRCRVLMVRLVLSVRRYAHADEA